MITYESFFEMLRRRRSKLPTAQLAQGDSVNIKCGDKLIGTFLPAENSILYDTPVAEVCGNEYTITIRLTM